jgi:hypothetical protein
MRFPALPLPPPSKLLLLSLVTPPPPPSSVVVKRDISGSGAPTGVFSPKKGDPSNVTGVAGIFDGSEPWENSVGAQETGGDQQRPLPPPPRLLWCPWSGNWRQMGGGGVELGLHVVHIRSISNRELAAAYPRPLGCDLNCKFFFYNLM